MKKCTRCFLIKPLEEFRARIRKNARGPKEERITHCRDCEKDTCQIRRKKQSGKIVGTRRCHKELDTKM